MNFEELHLSQHIIDIALLEAVECGWLSPVDHGFCFYCNNEKAVYEVTMETAPVQPPRCGECFFATANMMIDADPEKWQSLSDEN